MSTHRHSLGYDAYLSSPLWEFRRWWWWFWSDRRCEGCGCELVLHRCDLGAGAELIPRRVLSVNHRTYARLGRERRADVELLCWPCHRRRDAWRFRRIRR